MKNEDIDRIIKVIQRSMRQSCGCPRCVEGNALIIILESNKKPAKKKHGDESVPAGA